MLWYFSATILSRILWKTRLILSIIRSTLVGWPLLFRTCICGTCPCGGGNLKAIASSLDDLMPDWAAVQSSIRLGWAHHYHRQLSPKVCRVIDDVACSWDWLKIWSEFGSLISGSLQGISARIRSGWPHLRWLSLHQKLSHLRSGLFRISSGS